MRRTDKEITDEPAILAIIENAQVCRLAMADGNKPYMVPLCFGYENQTLFFHSALKGRKIDFLRKNPRVCFEFEAAVETVPAEEACSWGMQYKSVIGFGQAEFINDTDDKRRALDIIMAQYSDQIYQFPDDKLKATAVFKVEIDRMSGKQSGY